MNRFFRSLVLVAFFASIATPFSASARVSADEGGANPTSSSKTRATGVYIVQLADPPVVAYRGGTAQLPATSPRVTGDRKLNTQSSAVQSYRSYLQTKRSSAFAAIRRISPTAQVLVSYDTAYNGFAIRLTAEQAAQVAHLPGIARIQPETISSIQTDAGPSFIGAVQPDLSPKLFKVTISGANEVPPVTTPGTGYAVLTFDAGSRTLTFQANVRNTTGPITLAHIHRGAIGVAGPVAYDIMPKMITEGVYIGSVVISNADQALLYSNGLYLNFHTAANPGGEVRGQINADKGEGIIVGVIDTGINFTHASFAATGADGYTVVNPFGAGKYVGVCDPANPTYQTTFTCNNKLIGAWTWPATKGSPDVNGVPSPADDDEHGSHTGSTAAGNVVDSSVAGVNTGRVSGVAPHANIIAYDGCNTVSGCPGSALVASIDQAVKDGVDVINYSIGGGSRDPYTSPDAIAFFNAFDAGILAAVSAGNDGPKAQTIGSPSNAPWVLSVAASTHNRVFKNSLTNLTGGTGTPPPDLTGKGFSGSLATPTEIVYAGAAPYNNPLCQAFAAGTDLSGKIVVCDRGVNGRVEKSENVKKAGAAGFVLVNNAASGSSLNGDVYSLPGVHLTYTDGVVLKAWLATAGSHTGQISGAFKDLSAANGDIMASFSSRGPDLTSPDTLKPDVAAPGVDILAAINDTNPAPGVSEFGFLSGTSMAAPHTAGALALLRSLHPTWSAAEIQSALQTTAIQTLRKEDGTTPATAFDIGSGRIDVSLAARAALVLNITSQQFATADPTAGGKPRDLNRASLADSACVVTCSWTRVLSNTLGTAASWNVSVTNGISTSVTVEPSSFTIPAGGSQTIQVTANVLALAPGDYGFGNITLTPAGNLANTGVPVAHLPVAVQSVASTLPSIISIPTTSPSGTTTINNVRAINITNLQTATLGLAVGKLDDAVIDQDPTPNAPTDVLTTGVVLRSFNVITDTARFVTEVITTTATDLDMYVYLDGSGKTAPDGKPQADELVCTSATGSALESCDLLDPKPGTYLVLIQSFEASKRGADPLTLSTGIVPSTSANNFTVSAPSSNAANNPFSVTVKWNLPVLLPRQHLYGAFTLGANTSPRGALGVVRVNLYNPREGAFLPFIGK